MRYFKNSLVIMICCALALTVASCGSKPAAVTKAVTTIQDTVKKETQQTVTEPQETALPAETSKSTAAITPGALFQVPTEYQIELDGSAISAGDVTGMISDMDADGNLESFEISQGSPNVTNALAIVGDTAINTVEDFTSGSIFDANGDLNSNYFIQMTSCDLDGDEILELIVSAGDKSTEMETLVYSFDKAEQGFFFAGSITGQQYMYFEEGTINVPTGSEGVIEQYTYNKGSISPL